MLRLVPLLQEMAELATPREAVPEPGAEWVDVGSPRSFGLPDSPKPLPTPGKLLRHSHLACHAKTTLDT